MPAEAATAQANEPILLRQERDGIAYLTLNRPAQYNALSEELLAELQDALDDIAADDSLRVVVLAGSGKAFCAGHDLKQMRNNPDQDTHRRLFAQCSRMMTTLTHIPQPVIARIHGIACAAGCQLVATCDLAVAVEEARFGTNGINVGLFCSTPSVALSRNVARKKAFEMLVTGDLIDAATAVDYGLINRVVPAAELDAAVAELAEKIAAKTPVAVRTGKDLFYKQLEMTLDEAYGYAGEVMACNMMAEDVAEGIDAFSEKRKPVWKGR
ncbi:MAG: enoyl-CoA hydratase [Rhodospirillales bacterium]|nr:enoyl-CoA hydratase [Rhodospirillales bacterium]